MQWGLGVRRTATFGTYYGTFEKGRAHGYGIMEYDDGKKYQGAW